jgi:hypothetical protein
MSALGPRCVRDFTQLGPANAVTIFRDLQKRVMTESRAVTISPVAAFCCAKKGRDKLGRREGLNQQEAVKDADG